MDPMQMVHIPRRTATQLFLAGGLMAAVPGAPVTANQPPRRALALMCADTSDPLCRALFQALAEATSGYAIRFNPAPPVPGAPEVTVQRTASGPRLSWRIGTGPVATGAPVSAAAPRAQAKALLRATPDLLRALSAPSKP